MTTEEAKAEAAKLVDDAIRAGREIALTEYLNRARYEADHPWGRPFRDHNAVMRAAMRAAHARGVYYRRRVIR